ncbi:Ada metal-binding domain-containing protein [Clostridium formicaceticum]|uniref:Ada metal-binding domain-containing protein n=1 Tax=Clostridium formicaceticum TaxID=1497 RepID=UPI0009DA60E6|nr:Ada metal-binding domain-containing protein [Clostridium formicaceticum]
MNRTDYALDKKRNRIILYLFHIDSCSSLPAEHNRVYFSSRDEAINAGHTPCQRCKP